MDVKLLTRDDIFSASPGWREPGASNYLAMYSSVFGGVVKDPALMVMPLDDHIINRGDGIFEYFPVAHGHAYCMEAHLTRLRKSAEIISLELPFDMDTIRQITLETIAISGARSCGVRMFVSRGIGDFACDPTTPKQSLLYVVVLRKRIEDALPARMLTEGVSLMTTHVPIKPGFYAQVKSTDYLLNALVCLEAHRSNADFGVWFDENGYMTESSTESVVIVTEDGILKYPTFARMLKGVGLVRASQLATQLVASGVLQGICQTNITQYEAYESAEIMMMSSGTILPIVKFDGRTVGTGKPGPVFRALTNLFQQDMAEGPVEVRTPVNYPR